jgi:hypothetical protein
VARLKQVNGVGTLIALTYVLTLDDPHRFRRSRKRNIFWDCILGAGTLAKANRNCTPASKETAT